MKGLFLVALVVVIAGCTKSTIEDFELIEEKFNGNNTSGACPIGAWKNTTGCGGNKNHNFVLKADGTGWADNPDCANVCNPLKWPFTYEVIGNTCNLFYEPAPDVDCGGVFYDVDQPNDASFTFSCEGSTLVTSFGTFTK